MLRWQDEGSCVDYDTNLFFDKYEEDKHIASVTDALCRECPVNKTCLATAISNGEYGVWGGVYFEKGKISKEFNAHKSKEDWADTWLALTTELDVYE